MRRPSLRSLVGGVAGIGIGVSAGVVLTATSAAGPTSAAQPALIEAAHVPPALTLPGEPVRLRYALVCTPRGDGRPCDGSGTVYVRPDGARTFQAIPLRRDADSKDGRYYVDVSAASFSYYAVLRDEATGATVTVPSGGPDAPQQSLRVDHFVTVALGRDVFGRAREPDARVATAPWGSAPQDVGLAGSRELGFSGPSSFDVEPDGSVDVLDSVNQRVLRWARGRREVVPLPGATELADFAANDDGFEVLDVGGKLHAYTRDGSPQWTQQLADRTWAKLEHGSLVFAEPSEQWLPVAAGGKPLSRGEQARAARPAKPLANGHELIVDHVSEHELRLAYPNGTAWRITSETPLGEVQLAESLGDGLVLVTRAYTDVHDEFLVLLLGPAGLEQNFSVASGSWTETAPLARFRLVHGALYRFRTEATGAIVDRFDLEGVR